MMENKNSRTIASAQEVKQWMYYYLGQINGIKDCVPIGNHPDGMLKEVWDLINFWSQDYIRDQNAVEGSISVEKYLVARLLAMGWVVKEPVYEVVDKTKERGAALEDSGKELFPEEPHFVGDIAPDNDEPKHFVGDIAPEKEKKRARITVEFDIDECVLQGTSKTAEEVLDGVMIQDELVTDGFVITTQIPELDNFQDFFICGETIVKKELL